MKMPKAVYDALKADIEAVAEAKGINLQETVRDYGLRAMYWLMNTALADRAYDDSHPRYKVHPRILEYTGRNYSYLYDVGLTDAHIDTALGRMIKELETNQ